MGPRRTDGVRLAKRIMLGIRLFRLTTEQESSKGGG
jgi:hypothetical protein